MERHRHRRGQTDRGQRNDLDLEDTAAQRRGRRTGDQPHCPPPPQGSKGQTQDGIDHSVTAATPTRALSPHGGGRAEVREQGAGTQTPPLHMRDP